MLLTNSQNNIGRSAIDASLKHSSYDVLTPKNSFREFNKVFGPTLTYSSADNLFYYIGYEDYPKSSSEEEEIIDNIINIDLGDSSFYNHKVLKRGNVLIDPTENHNSNFNGSAQFNGKEDYLEVVGAQDAFTSVSSAFGGAFTLEFWIKPTNLDDDTSLYQTVVSVGAQDINGSKGFPENGWPLKASADLDVSLGTSNVGGWTKGKLYVKAWPGQWFGNFTILDLTSTTVLQNDTWYHIAIVREDPSYGSNNQSEVRLYVNGNKEASTSWENTIGIGYHNGDGLGDKLKTIVKNLPIYIGAQGQIDIQRSSLNNDGTLSVVNFYGHYEGYLNELRISRTIRYTGDSFTVPSFPFTALFNNDPSNTKLLIQSFRETQNSTNVIDKSPSKHSITNTNVIHDLEHEQWGVDSTSGYDKSKLKFTHSTNLRIPHSDEFNFKHKTTRIDLWVFSPDNWGYSSGSEYTDAIDTFKYKNVLINRLKISSYGTYAYTGWILYVDTQGYLWLEVYPKNCNYNNALGTYECEQNGFVPDPSNPNVRYSGKIRSLEKLEKGKSHFITILFVSGYNSNEAPHETEPDDTVEMFVGGAEQDRLFMRPSKYKDSKNEWDNGADLRIGPSADNNIMYMDDIKWTSVDNSLITAETAHKYRYLNPEIEEEFLPPKGQFGSEYNTSTSLLLHLDATGEGNQSVDKLEKGNYGLCTFNPLTLQTENIHKFNKPQYKAEIVTENLPGSKSTKREYSLPRDIAYSPYENSLLMTFHEHKQEYSFTSQWIAGSGYGGGGGSSSHQFDSTSSFILYKYDIEARKITSSDVLWTRSWVEDFINAGYLVRDLMSTVAGLDNKYYSFPSWLYQMFTSLSMNPRSGEALALHSKGGFGWTNSYRTALDERPDTWSKLDYEEINSKGTVVGSGVVKNYVKHGGCVTNRKCLNFTSYSYNSIWDVGRFGAPWRFSLFQNGGLGMIPTSAEDYESNNCLEFCDQGGSSRGDGSGTNFITGITPRKLIFAPSTGSYYHSSNDIDSNLCFMYDNNKGEKTLSGNYLINIQNGIIQDGIYIPSQDLMLYLIYNQIDNETNLTYVNVCKPDYDITTQACDTISPLNKTIDLDSAQSLIYCPSNDKIYVLGESVLLKIRPDDLEIEDSFVAPTGNKTLTTKGLKAFIPMYSHTNDTIFFFSNDIDRDSFLFEPNY
tara:strand:+ start:15604 stop:19146 length:3543 start_codon:yes stop_codon:yes gene_type:complete